MNKVKLLVIVSSGLMMANIILLVLFFGGGWPFRPSSFREPKDIIAERLRLDAAQFQKFEKMVQVHREEIRKCDRELNDAKRAMMNSLIDSSENQNLDSLTHAIGELQAKAEIIRYQHLLGIKKICRKDQLDAYKEIIEDLPKIMRGPEKRPGPMPHDEGPDGDRPPMMPGDKP